MNEPEVMALLLEMRAEYDWVDVSEAEVSRLSEYLEDIPWTVARKNVIQHIKTNPKRAPKIADIRGAWGEDKEHEHLKAQTVKYLAERERAEKHIKLPPAGTKEALYEQLGIKPRATE